jgi:RNA polymerase subunit RPABC4/transcription elongation factor Spt4
MTEEYYCCDCELQHDEEEVCPECGSLYIIPIREIL